MAVQTSYSENIAPGVAGARADQTPVTFISREVEVTDGIPFGAAAARGVGERGIVLTTGATDDFIGVVVLERTPRVRATNPDRFSFRDSARVATEGAFWVITTQNVKPGDPVHALANGTWGKSGGTHVTLATWESFTVGGGLAKLRLGTATAQDNTPSDLEAPVLSTAATPAAGTTVVLTYDGPLKTTPTPAASAFSVIVNGSPKAVNTVAIAGSAVTLTLAAPTVKAGETVAVTYTKPTANPIQDAAGNAAASLTDRAVTNNSTQS